MARIVCRLKELIAHREVMTGERLSYVSLAGQIGVSEKTLRRWANNQVESYDKNVLLSLCLFFERGIEDVISLIADDTPESEIANAD